MGEPNEGNLGSTDADVDPVHSSGLLGCVWVQDENGVWETQCGNAHEFYDGGPSDNFYRYCPYCGKIPIEKKYGVSSQ